LSGHIRNQPYHHGSHSRDLANVDFGAAAQFEFGVEAASPEPLYSSLDRFPNQKTPLKPTPMLM
jgi:hypothetical protein